MTKNYNYMHMLATLESLPCQEILADWQSVKCLEWDRGRHRQGYGILRVDGRFTLSHIAAYAATKGHVDKGMMVLHLCDNPPCYHPAHLYLGTQTDNMRDMVARSGRVLRDQDGEANCSSKLSGIEVRQMIRMYTDGETQTSIATQFKVSKATVSKIMSGQLWVHIDVGINLEDV
jgi:hypothetical protein